jgi:methylthioribose-1-phosphate isomerase
MIAALAWKDDCLEILDQTQLPKRTCYRQLHRIEEVYEAIQTLRVRGAPAIGITAAYGLYLGMRQVAAESRKDFFRVLQDKVRCLASARPTAVNLSWALAEVQRQLQALPAEDVVALRERLLALAVALHEDDRRRCQAIAEHGQQLVPAGAHILTHCNAGALATGGIGTALGIVYLAHERGRQVRVFADETRPLLQGARLTMWELTQAGVPAQLICDNMAAALMGQKQVDLVIVGADRIAADGSVANKIGTYSLAIAAQYHGIAFYVAAPLSTFDSATPTGAQIPIEMRDEDEVRRVFHRMLITLPQARCWNPAFDVTPPELVTAIITERGLVRPPYEQTIRALLAGPPQLQGRVGRLDENG